jgi:hypothetical protein
MIYTHVLNHGGKGVLGSASAGRRAPEAISGAAPWQRDLRKEQAGGDYVRRDGARPVIYLVRRELGAKRYDLHDYDPSDEYALMAEAGMSFRQILASVTTAPAERFGESEGLGQIVAGLTADLVVLGQDPAKNVRAFAAACYKIRDGRLIYKANTGTQGRLRGGV